MPETGAYVDPFNAYNFKLEIQGLEGARFTECTGIGIRVQDIRYREAGIDPAVHRLVGPVEYADITLRYGLTGSMDLWNWFMTAVAGRVQRKNASVVLLGNDGVTEAARWNLINAWPAAWHGAPLNAMGREVAIESLTLVFEKLERG
ncbi:MAG: phage tail protein [Gemmatimonadetes bacterium]|nr:phage tail protein [Gemmatimonadota bacterium]